MRTDTHAKGRGLVVHARAGDTLAALDREQLAHWLGRHGYLVLRGFDCGVAQFSALVKNSSSRISLDPARRFHDSDGEVLAQMVDAGVDAIGLHCENGNSPFWPDLCWFFCTEAPQRGSQTTLCDGAAVFHELAPQLRTRLLAQDIVYTRRVPQPLWKNYVRHAFSGGPEASDTNAAFERLLALVNDIDSTSIALHEDGAITYRFRTPAILARSVFSPGLPAFANSILGPSFNYERPQITFADGTPLNEQLRTALAELCERHTVEVGWRQRDIVVIDNARVMHGRRRIEDSHRTIYNALSYY